MRNTLSWLPAYLVFGAALAAVVACQRSESVGWADREGPGSVPSPRTGAASSSPSPSEQAAPGSPSAIVMEYQQLAMALDTLRERAMADELLAAEWSRLQADVEARIAEGSAFHRGLIARRAEIEARWAEAQETGVPVPPEEFQQLVQHYSNIQAEFSRVRTRLLEEDPQLAARLIALQGRTFDKMRELEPARAAEIDRVEELEHLLFNPQSPLP